ncbi:ketopantoate reductase family protein [Miltoncostaea marina]|uniref:ketopantoate reductase family protein n=1 Tax=Miltoncostaea marina TaxID=2843215 RepID=UPI001C3DBDE5|nr:2-dehydropantoate 2-reductase [Miltoncostaea marina]
MGAGAVGTYYGALLARAGHDVTLVARGAHLAALRRRGAAIVREPDGTRWEAPARAAGSPGAAPAPDLAIVATKSHHTAAAAEALAAALPAGAPVLSLQNGVENVGRLAAALGAGRVLGGIAFVGVRVAEPGVVDHEAEGWVRIGDPAGATPLARRVHELVAPAWDVRLSEDIVHEQWRKLLWNAGFNAICAVTGATAGQALATPASRALVREAMEEVVAVAAAGGVVLTPDEVDEMAAFNEQLRDYRPSTARDLDAGKRLERDALCGFLAREGAARGVATPVNRVLDGLLALREDVRAAGSAGGGR